MNLTQVVDTGLGALKSLGGPIGAVKTACNLSSHVPPLSGLGQKLLKRVNWAEGPPEIAALMADALALSRLRWSEASSAKITELAASILKKCCTIFQWLDQRHIVAVNPATLSPIQGISVLCDMVSSSLEVIQNLDADPKDRQLLAPACKCVKAFLVFYMHQSENKQLNIVATGLGVIADGYTLFQKCKKIPLNPKDWKITIPPASQIISIIVLAGLALYVIEKKVQAENFH